MAFAIGAPVVDAARVQHLGAAGARGEALAVLEQGLRGDLVEGEPFNATDRAGEAARNDGGVEPEDFEDLGALVGGEGGDAHL